MRHRSPLPSPLLALILCFFFGCSDDLSPSNTGDNSGVLSVRIVDPALDQAVAGVEVEVVGGGQAARTDSAGVVRFYLEPGEYHVDSSVCCVGPGYIEYHVPVTVSRGDTVEVTLHACLYCE